MHGRQIALKLRTLYSLLCVHDLRGSELVIQSTDALLVKVFKLCALAHALFAHEKGGLHWREAAPHEEGQSVVDQGHV